MLMGIAIFVIIVVVVVFIGSGIKEPIKWTLNGIQEITEKLKKNISS
jgi:hypothetical protein